MIIAAFALLWSADVHAAPPAAEDIAFFERDIRPILSRHCYACHSADAKDLKSGLLLDNREKLLAGGDRGPAAIAGEANDSLLMTAVSYEDEDLQMPPEGKLTDAEIRLLREWIDRGLPMPAAHGLPAVSAKIDWDAARKFWSFQPPSRHPLPQLNDPSWPQTRADHFILAAMQREGLAPSPPADRRTWIRRATFDLTGLPPTPEEITAFLADDSPDAYARLVDRLLASPHYGERWGRYWLDLARYTDRTATWLKSTGQAHLYRDWVVRALNNDMAYPKFVKRQLATDMMAETSPQDLSALGLLGLSPEYWKELQLSPELIKKIVAEEWEERVDLVGRSFLGLTLACARCHDHKFDPITTEDYYALAGVFASVRLADRLMLPDEEAAVVKKAREEAARMEKQLEELRKQKKPSPEKQAEIRQLAKRIQQIKQTTPHYDAPEANAVEEASLYVLPQGENYTRLEYQPGQPRNLRVQLRGEPTRLGEEVPRRFLQVLAPDGMPAPFMKGSGRLELAEAIVGEGAPLAARVIVNRVWMHHFGVGLVTTPSNFGAQGAAPTHPKLLDDLTANFIRRGWSLKWLHRQIMLSAAYRQNSQFDADKAAIDPANRWLWRMNRRRLEIEAWRDAALSVTGEIELRMGGPSQDLGDGNNRRRTIYGTVHRRDLNVMLRLYDFPDPTKHSPQRTPTTTPLQQLFVLNSPFMQKRADALVERLAAEAGDDDADRIHRVYALLFARLPSEKELDTGLAFLAEASDSPQQAWSDYAQALLASNEFLFVD